MRSHAVRATRWVSHRSRTVRLVRPKALAAALFALLASPMALAQPSSPTGLRSVGAIRHLKQPISPGAPLHIRGVATYYDTVAPNLFVQDSTGGIWVDLRGVKATPPSPGDVLDLRGSVGAGFTPYVANPSWAVVGKSPFPKPVHLTYDDAATGAWDSQWVQLVFLYSAVVLIARRLHDMGWAAWPLIVPAALVIAMAWLYLYVPTSEAKVNVKWAAIIVSAAFMVWGLLGKSQAEPNRFGAPAA